MRFAGAWELRRLGGGTALGSGVALWLAATPVAAQERLVEFQIGPQPLQTALLAYGRATDLQILFSGSELHGRTTPGLSGRYEPSAALDRLLVGSDLAWRRAPSGAILIETRSDRRPQGLPAAEAVPAGPPRALDEVVVTGTNLRRGDVIGLTQEISRDDFERQGFLDVGEAVRSLPANFGGGVNPETAVASGQIDGASLNRSRTSSPNLRGLGSGATLTLLNGRRLPAAGEGVAVDLSVVPNAAIERVDVLADGASAIYGADAVGGVVNIVTRRSLEGGEARLRYGGAEGGLETRVASLLAGHRWGGFEVVLAAEYFQQDPLNAAKRDMSRNLPQPFELFPEMARASYYGAATYEVSDGVSLFGTALYSQRIGTTTTNTGASFGIRDIKNAQHIVSGGAQIDLGETWRLDLTGTTAENVAKNPASNFRTTGVNSFSVIDQRNALGALEATASGQVFESPGGPVDLALGVGYREEELSSPSDPVRFAKSREVKSAFIEANIPLIGPENAQPWARGLRLSLAGRHDDYSDFGGVSVPRLGAEWILTPSVKLSASYSKSFRAPALTELVSIYSATFVNSLSNAPAGVSRNLVLFGTGGTLDPERAETRNVTVSYTPDWLPTARAALSYFRITYDGRIAAPDPTSLFRGDIRNAPAVLLNTAPTQAEIAALLGGANFVSALAGATTDPALVTVILDNRSRNIASTRIDGVQLTAAYSRDTRLGVFSAATDVNWINRFENRLLPGSPVLDRAGTVFSPPHWRARTNVQWAADMWSGSLTWNYAEDYIDNRVTPTPMRIEAWNTFDGSLTFRVGEAYRQIGRRSRVILSINNIFDAEPPRISRNTGSFPTFWDPTNASIIGRFASVELVAAW